MSKARASVTKTEIVSWFNQLKEHLEEENCVDILDDPNRIFNLDETGVCVCPKSGKVLGLKGAKNFYEIATGDEKLCISVLCTFSASGKSIEPLIV